MKRLITIIFLLLIFVSCAPRIVSIVKDAAGQVMVNFTAPEQAHYAVVSLPNLSVEGCDRIDEDVPGSSCVVDVSEVKVQTLIGTEIVEADKAYCTILYLTKAKLPLPSPPDFCRVTNST